jgi:hypothetical protein
MTSSNVCSSIAPPPELVQQWIKEFSQPNNPRWQEYEQDIAARAAEWGVSQFKNNLCSSSNYRNHLGLKEQALMALEIGKDDNNWTLLTSTEVSIIRQALELFHD